MPRRKKRLPKNGLAIIQDMASRGCREVDIASGLGMCWQTFNNLRQEDARIQQAMDAGSSLCHEKIYGKLFQLAMEGDTVACLFLLKTRHGYKEGYSIEKTNNVRISFEMPGALPVAAYEKLINPPELLTDE